MTNARTLGNIGRNADLENGGGLVLLATNTVTSNVNAVDFDLPAAYTRYKLIVQAADANNSYPILRASLDGGSTFITSSDYGNIVLKVTLPN